MTVDIADVLEAAAERVRAGWTQHQAFEEVDGQLYVCASAAIFLSTGMKQGENATGDQGVLYRDCVDALTEHVGQPTVCWNDSIGQTQDRVADTMLRLAKELRNNETP